MYGNPYTQSSIKIGSNSGVSVSGAPGFNISQFSGITPTNCKINIDFSVGRINSDSRMNLDIPLFSARGVPAEKIGGTALCINNSDNLVFYGEDIGIQLENDCWQKFSISIDTSSGEAYLYLNGKRIASKYLGRVRGIDSLDFSFPNTAGGAWYIDSINVNTSDSLPQFDSSDIKQLSALHFDGLKTNTTYDVSGVSYVNFSDSASNVFQMQAANAAFGKADGDIALGITNTSDVVNLSRFSAGDADERYHAIRITPGKPQMTSADTYVFKAQMAVSSLNCTKRIKATAYTGKYSDASVGDLVNFGANGTVSVFGNPLRDNGSLVTVIPGKWYDIKVVMVPSNGSTDNLFSVYWDGKLLIENKKFNVNDRSKIPFEGLSSVEVGYDIKYCPISDSEKLSDGNYSRYMEDGMYVDNLDCTVYSGNKPKFAETNAMSTNPYYANTIDENMVYSYGQNIQKFLSSIGFGSLSSAAIVSEYGKVISNGNLPENGYLRMVTPDGNQLFRKIAKGTNEYLASLGNAINAENSYNSDMSSYYIYEQPDVTKIKNSILDVSNVTKMNASSGKLTQIGDKFVDLNGNEVHLWGTNLADRGCFPDTHEEAEKLADRIAAAGFNLVRIHNYCTLSSGSLYGTKTDGEFDANQLDKLLYLISELKKRNIYYYFDAPSRRIFDSDDFEDASLISNSMASIVYFNQKAAQIMDDDIKKLFTAENKYTGMTLAGDPNLLCIELRNEHDFITYDFENSSFRSSKYYTELSDMYRHWLLEKYGSVNGIENAWAKKNSDVGSIGLQDSEMNGTINLYYPYSTTRGFQLTSARWNDQDRFSSYVMEKFYTDRKGKMRENGITCSVTCTSSIGNHMPLYYVNAKTDFSDYHGYWSHPSGGELGDVGTRFDTNSAYGSGITGITSSLKNSNFGLFGDMAQKRVYGKPYFIGEWKVCPGNPYFAEGPVVMSTLGKMQGWNPMEFCFSTYTDYFAKTENGNGYDVLRSVFVSVNNPVLTALWPTASVMFLRDISEADSGYYSTRLTDETNIYAVGKSSSGTIWPGSNNKFGSDGKIALIGKTGVAYAGDTVSNNNEIKSLADSYSQLQKYTSLSGEISADTNNGIYTAHTDKSSAICGFVGKNSVNSGSMSIRVDNDYAAAMLVTVDDKDISSSGRMLLTLAGNATNYGQLMSEDGCSIAIVGKSPIMTEQITGEIFIKAVGNYEVYSLTSSGERKNALNVTKANGGFKFNVTNDVHAMSFEIVKK